MRKSREPLKYPKASPYAEFMFTRIVLAAVILGVTPAAFAADAKAPPGSSSQTQTLPGGAVAHFSKDAVWELGRAIKLQLSGTGQSQTPVQVVKLSKGRVSIELPELKVPKSAVLVQGPRKVGAIAKGGESLVIAEPDRVTIAAIRGEMVAALGNTWKVLAAGRERSFGSELVERAIPTAPKLITDHTLLLALGGAATARISAPAESEVEQRELLLYRLDNGSKVLVSNSEWRSESHSLESLVPGCYEVTARNVDRFGVQSEASAPLTLRVVGVVLPEDARIQDGELQLRRSSRVKLIGAEDLEASYGRATAFVRAPSDVGLVRGGTTLLRLREAGTTQELQIVLEPRQLHAAIEIGPKDVRWPHDALEVQVKLFDLRGRPVADALKTKPKVFLNLGPLDLTWTHAGTTWTTKVTAGAVPGPWLVRVEVNDDFGELVGRDFIQFGVRSGSSVALSSVQRK